MINGTYFEKALKKFTGCYKDCDYKIKIIDCFMLTSEIHFKNGDEKYFIYITVDKRFLNEISYINSYIKEASFRFLTYLLR